MASPPSDSLVLQLDSSARETVSLNSGNVSKWSDKSGNGNDATEGTPANQPLYDIGALNGLNGVSYDTIDDSLSAGSGASIDKIFFGGGAFYIAFQLNNVSATRRILYKSEWQINSIGGAPFDGIQLRHEHSVAFGRWELRTGFAADTPVILGVEYDNDSNSNDAVFYLNSTTASIPTELDVPSGIAVDDSARTLIVGNDVPGGGTPLDGIFFEILGYSSIPSSSDRADLFTYLSNKWGIALS